VIARAASCLLALVVGGGQAIAGNCPEPASFVIAETQLTAAREAVAKGHLTILVLGDPATAGAAAHGLEFTYPARLQARLRDALPSVDVKLEVRAVEQRSGNEILSVLDAALKRDHPSLVLWGLGARAAVRGEDIDRFVNTLDKAIVRVRAAGADLILMTLQYAPSVVRLINLAPYRMAVMRTGESAGIAVFDRYEFMRAWHKSGFVNLDATGPGERVNVARRVFDCMAAALSEGIAGAVR
jgi:hypothetical protein